MCSICHQSVNGNDPPRKAFPDKFKESFNMKFDHAQHMTGGARPKNGCTACHSSAVATRRGLVDSCGDGRARWLLHLSHAERAANGRDLASCGVCHAPRLTRVRQLIRRRIELASVMRNTARGNGSNVRAVTTTRRVCRRGGKSVRRALSNISRLATIPARPATTAGDHSVAIRISRRAGVVMQDRVFGRDD